MKFLRFAPKSQILVCVDIFLWGKLQYNAKCRKANYKLLLYLLHKYHNYEAWVYWLSPLQNHISVTIMVVNTIILPYTYADKSIHSPDKLTPPLSTASLSYSATFTSAKNREDQWVNRKFAISFKVATNFCILKR